MKDKLIIDFADTPEANIDKIDKYINEKKESIKWYHSKRKRNIIKNNISNLYFYKSTLARRL